jgi:lipopolysaccharide exporter
MPINPLKYLLGDKSGSYWVKAGSLTLMSRVSNVGFAFLNFYLLIRLLDIHNFGIWTLYITVCTLLELLKNGFIGNPLIKHAAETKGIEYKNVLSSSLLLNALVGVLEVSLLLIFSYTLPLLWDAPELSSLFLIYIIPSILLIPISHLTFIQQANLDFKGGFFASLFRYMSLFIFLVYFFIAKVEISLVMLAWIQVISFGGSAIIAIFFGKKYFEISRKISKEWVLKLFHYGKYTLGTNLTSNVLRNIDTWMLGSIIGAPAVAIYNPAVRVANLFEVPTVALNTIVFPKLLKEVQDKGKDSIKYLFEKSVALLLAVMVPFVAMVVLFSEEVVYLVAGKGFEETAAVLQITMLYGLILPFNRQVGITLDAIGKPGTNFFFVLVTTIANTIINYFLITHMGVLGAALSTLISFGIAYVMNYFYFNKRYAISNLNIIKYSVGYYGQGFKMLTRKFQA